MVTEGKILPRTAIDYISRLKFLSNDYPIDSFITEETIGNIIAQEEVKRSMRDKYTTKHAIADFRAGLNKFLAFVRSDYNSVIAAEVEKVEKSADLHAGEREAVIQSRIGQGLFRHKLIDYWKGCSVTGCDVMDILVASHIKPWRDSNNVERVDEYNGLLLLPNYDKLFDLGYMTVDLGGHLRYSRFFPEKHKSLIPCLSVSIARIDDRHKPYLEYHNRYCFMQ
jgi:hypothetical protein